MALANQLATAEQVLEPPVRPSSAGARTAAPAYKAPDQLAWEAIAAPLAAAEAGLARLDTSVAGSAVGAGWQARNDFADACASLGLEGKLIHLEDLVLHDAEMQIYPPTFELVRARHVLHDRRRIAANEAGWSLTSAGLRTLQGKPDASQRAVNAASGQGVEAGAAARDDFQALLDGVDAAISKSNKVLAEASEGRISSRDPLVYDPAFNEEARLADWQRILTQTERYPPTLQAAIALDAWRMIDPLEHQAWLGPLLVADHLRRRSRLKALPCLNCGMKLVDRKRRWADSQMTRLAAGLEAIAAMAEAGLKDHNRLVTARRLMGMKLKDRRSTSRLPALIDYVIRQPIVTTGMIANELRITPRAAQGLVAELSLRELTGRGRYRGWGVLS